MSSIYLYFKPIKNGPEYEERVVLLMEDPSGGGSKILTAGKLIKTDKDGHHWEIFDDQMIPDRYKVSQWAPLDEDEL